MENIFSVTRRGEFTRLQTSLQKKKKGKIPINGWKFVCCLYWWRAMIEYVM